MADRRGRVALASPALTHKRPGAGGEGELCAATPAFQKLPDFGNM